MKLLALDISAASTGVAIGEATALPRSFTVSFHGAGVGDVGAQYAKWLRDLLMIEKPATVVFEAPLLRASAKGSTAAMYLLIGLAFQTEVICAIRGISAYSVQVQTWRKMFLGSGRPSNPKKEALAMCALLGWETGGSHDRAEACGVWAWGHFNFGDTRAIQRALSASSVQRMTA